MLDAGWDAGLRQLREDNLRVFDGFPHGRLVADVYLGQFVVPVGLPGYPPDLLAIVLLNDKVVVRFEVVECDYAVAVAGDLSAR
ncbi:hypothetical protein [Halorussus limi]|uniref:hypothetical protein n=1 Tax=Halorussus limi TaxID=2938695 RepID=UPI003F648F27